ncbi:MAG: GDSL-type esterase/lipase family protein, partial [Myxococcales bacterium]|nr:GDSL-type esterase/lipase family protein [Myxococcales bacterium]
MRGASRLALVAFFFVSLAAASPLLAQTVSGVAFDDADGDGLRDAGEAPIAGVSARLYGQLDAGGTFDQTVATAADGVIQFSPGNGCYLLQVTDPSGWRRSPARFDLRAQGSPGYTHPVGLRRFGGSPQLLDELLTGSFRYTSIGDSIAWNWNSCFDTSSFWYSQQIQSRLGCVVPTATVSLDESAIKGEHTDDLLVDQAGELNNVFRVIDASPQLVTISMVGNDLLDDEPASATPTQGEINRFVEELIDSRSNLQEVLSALVSELPNAEIELNTLYDNLSYNCSGGQSNQLHDEWIPILNQILRDVAWGQARRVTNAEVNAEFARADLSGACTGFEDEICQFLDGIHPRHTGYEIIREKLWEALDGVSLGPKDALGATSITDADHGYLRHAIRLLPTDWSVLSGASVIMPVAALDDDDGGAAASVTLGIGSEEFRLSGFPDWYDEFVPVKVIAGVRYRTSGS